jgi:hypothetical protein
MKTSILAYFQDLNCYKLLDGEITVSWGSLKEQWSNRSTWSGYKDDLTFFQWLECEASEYFAGKYLGV